MISGFDDFKEEAIALVLYNPDKRSKWINVCGAIKLINL